MMGHKRKRKSQHSLLGKCLATGAVLLVLVAGTMLAHHLEAKLTQPVQNAGEQITAYSDGATGAQVFMNGQWYAPRNVETVLIIGIDEFGYNMESNSYNNTNQADFLALFIRDTDTGDRDVIHLNRDTMTTLPVLGVTGEAAGTRYAQLALAYNYGSGGTDSSLNTVKAVSHLLYGVNIDHFITVTMDAVPILNDWAGGVTVEVLDDLSGIDATLAVGQEVKLHGQQALTYIRTRLGLEDSTNLHRMNRQRQYASQWVKTAQPRLNDQGAVADLVMQMSDHHYSDCTVDELLAFSASLGQNTSLDIHELAGEAVQGEQYIEYIIDDESVQQLVLELFYRPATH